jgi:hypothetical protein
MTERLIHDVDADDRRLRALLAAVPRRMPSAAFQARLLMATQNAWPARARAREWGVSSELVVSVAVVTAALFVDAGVVLRVLTRGCVLLAEWMNAGASMWDLLARSSLVLGSAVASPGGTIVLLGGVLTASLALAGLSRVLPRQQGDV